MRRHTLYKFAMAGGVLITAGGLVAAYSGNLESLVAADELPGEPWYGFVGAGAAVLIGALAMKVLTTRAWTGLADGTDLTAEGSGVFGKPDLTGTVRGRPVRAKTVHRKKSTDDGSTTVTYTVVEADLESPTDVGLLIGHREDGGEPGRTDFGNASVQNVELDDEFVLVGGGDEGLAREMLTQRTRGTLRALRDGDTIAVGDPTNTILKAMPDTSGSFLGGLAQDELSKQLSAEVAGSRSTVAVKTEDLVLDASEIDRQVTAAAALADSFEAAVADAPPA